MKTTTLLFFFLGFSVLSFAQQFYPSFFTTQAFRDWVVANNIRCLTLESNPNEQDTLTEEISGDFFIDIERVYTAFYFDREGLLDSSVSSAVMIHENTPYRQNGRYEQLLERQQQLPFSLADMETRLGPSKTYGGDTPFRNYLHHDPFYFADSTGLMYYQYGTFEDPLKKPYHHDPVNYSYSFHYYLLQTVNFEKGIPVSITHTDVCPEWWRPTRVHSYYISDSSGTQQLHTESVYHSNTTNYYESQLLQKTTSSPIRISIDLKDGTITYQNPTFDPQIVRVRKHGNKQITTIKNAFLDRNNYGCWEYIAGNTGYDPGDMIDRTCYSKERNSFDFLDKATSTGYTQRDCEEVITFKNNVPVKRVSYHYIDGKKKKNYEEVKTPTGYERVDSEVGEKLTFALGTLNEFRIDWQTLYKDVAEQDTQKVLFIEDGKLYILKAHNIFEYDCYTIATW